MAACPKIKTRTCTPPNNSRVSAGKVEEGFPLVTRLPLLGRPRVGPHDLAAFGTRRLNSSPMVEHDA